MDALDRMFHVLVRNLRSKHPTLSNAPFTVGELHQMILPYRHYRRDLGLETNQEYELVMMELLTGARGYLDVDEKLRDQLGKELAAQSPEPARVREFAESHVSVNPSAEATVPAFRATPQTTGGRAQVPGVAPGGAAAAPAAAPLPNPSACRYCAMDLPDVAGRPLNFCPNCGQNLQVHNCPACGAELEPAWKFCVGCGKGVA